MEGQGGMKYAQTAPGILFSCAFFLADLRQLSMSFELAYLRTPLFLDRWLISMGVRAHHSGFVHNPEL